MHRFFLSLDPRNETEGSFVEGSEENVLGKAGALYALDEDGNGDRKQDVMILSRNGRCENHMKEGFWYVLMRVEQVVEVKENVGIGLADGLGDGALDGVVGVKRNVGIGLGDGVVDGVANEVVNEVVERVVDGEELDHEIDLDLYT